MNMLPPTARVELASQPQFRVGAIIVTPTLLAAASADRRVTLEPRVMQVLVVLGEEPGRVVSRSELVERCWDGRFVGDNAIQRVISRLRHAGAELGGFEVEAISKVGYRLRLEAEPAVSPLPAVPAPVAACPPAGWPLDRRLMLAGLAGAGGLAATGLWRSSTVADPASDRARMLLTRARDAQMMGLPEQNEQAIAYLEQATEIAPDLSQAWGQLALAQVHMMDWLPDAQLPAQVERARSAAATALRLEPGQPDAELALVSIPPDFHNWQTKEAKLRRLLARHGGSPALDSALGFVMCDTGQWRRAIGHFRRALAFEPLNIPSQITLVRALWGHGQLAEADAMLEKGLKTWPRHSWMWRMRFDFLAMTGRPRQALAMITNEDARPLTSLGERPPPYAALTAFAEALVSRTPAAIEKASALLGVSSPLGPIGFNSFHAMALGLTDRVFDLFELYYFGGPGQPPPTPLSRRKTAFLFTAENRPLRAMTRFQQIVDRLALPAYWRATGTRPDPDL